jgi:hypothetical protein
MKTKEKTGGTITKVDDNRAIENFFKAKRYVGSNEHNAAMKKFEETRDRSLDPPKKP